MNRTITINSQETIVYDDASLGSMDTELFSPKEVGGAASVNSQGRGSVYMFHHQGLDLVLRHYCRGGMIRHFIQDRYWFATLGGTRMWREFSLLQALEALNLPVPRAIAARCVKTSPITCRGDLLTELIPNSQTLAEVLEQKTLKDQLWSSLGSLIARFHRHNVFHADLNANNILLSGGEAFFLIDFDRGELRASSAGGAWKRSNLKRLQRSLLKLSKRNPSFHFSGKQWQILLKAYAG